MKITFCGAARTVTGSCHLLEAGGKRLLIDCGLFQGRDAYRNDDAFPFDPASIDYVVLTHAHNDHIGRVPTLVDEGFKGEIVASKATAELAIVAWLDGARHDDSDFDAGDVEATWQQVAHKLDPHQPLQLSDDLRLTLLPAGHIFGSCSVLIESEGKRVCFSGDIGRPQTPIIKDPEPPSDCDAIVIESTYGTREHPALGDVTDELLETIEHADKNGGNIVIPSFALGRSQEVLYRLNDLAEASLLEHFTVYFDSPLAIRYTEVFQRHPGLFDADARMLLDGGDHPFRFSNLRVTVGGRASRNIADDTDHAIIVASGGMCEGGRVLRHLKRELPRARSDVLFIGYQAHGTRGRQLVDGASAVEIDGQDVPVRAQIHRLPGFSGHGGKTELLDWARAAARPGARAFVVHGEPDSAEAFAGALESELSLKATVPNYRQTVTL